MALCGKILGITRTGKKNSWSCHREMEVFLHIQKRFMQVSSFALQKEHNCDSFTKAILCNILDWKIFCICVNQCGNWLPDKINIVEISFIAKLWSWFFSIESTESVQNRS